MTRIVAAHPKVQAVAQLVAKERGQKVSAPKLGVAGYLRPSASRVLSAFAPLSAVRGARRKSLATLDPLQHELAHRRAILICGCEQYRTLTRRGIEIDHGRSALISSSI